MTEFYKFSTDNPWLTFFLVCVTEQLVFRVVNRFYRVLNILFRGWPPSHCDADGDFENKEDTHNQQG
jgi:hypothetical protein